LSFVFWLNDFIAQLSIKMNVLATSYILPLPVSVPQLTTADTIVAITMSTTSSPSLVSVLHTTTTNPFVIKFTNRPIYLHDSSHFFLFAFILCTTILTFLKIKNIFSSQTTVQPLTTTATTVAVTTSTIRSTSSVSALHTTTTSPFVIKFTGRPVYLHDSSNFFCSKFVCIHFVYNNFDLFVN
jgi:hypothetical protein